VTSSWSVFIQLLGISFEDKQPQAKCSEKKQPIFWWVVYNMRFWIEHEGGFVLVFHEK